MDTDAEETEKLHSHMDQLMAMLYAALDELPKDEADEIRRVVTHLKARAATLDERAGLALNIALFESRGNGFDPKE